MVNRFYKRREPGEQLKMTARLNIIVRQRANDKAIDGLRLCKVETIEAQTFAINEDNKGVTSRLTGIEPQSVMAFGTADQ